MTSIETGTSLEHRVGPRGRFVLLQSSGEISIRGVEGDTIRVRAVDDEPLEDRFTITTGADVVELRQLNRIGKMLGGVSLGIFGLGNGGAELEIEVPHGATVSIESASAEIEASDLSGSKTFRTASGDVSLNRMAGAVTVETVSGDVEIQGNAPIALVAKTVSGDLDVRVPQLRDLDLGTTSGDLRLDAELAGNGAFALRSISGDAMIVGRSSFRVEAETITGDLSSDVPAKRESFPGRRVLTVGRNGPTLKYRSVSGDLRVTQPRDAAPSIAGGPDVQPPDQPAPPAPPAPPAAPSAPSPEVKADLEARRMEILQALERGEIDVAEAGERLGRVDQVLR